MGGVFHGSKIKNVVRIDNPLIRECLAEFLGTFLLVGFGLGAMAQVTLPPKVNIPLAGALGWGLACAMAIWSSGGVSGGHVNPALSLAMAVIGKLPFYKVPIYFLGQYLGAFAAAACVCGIYRDALNSFDGGIRVVAGENATAGIFTTFALPHVSNLSAFGDQVFATMLFVLCVLAIIDKRNIGCETGLIPLCVCLLITALGISFSHNCGCPINPARDLSPRLFTLLAGWGKPVFTAHNYYCWVPILGPHVGGICGALVYQLMVGLHIPDDD